MKTIAIDANEANINQRLGVNVYAYELLQAIYKLQDIWKERFKFVVYLSREAVADLPKEVSGVWEYKIIKGKGLWVLTKLLPHLLINPNKVSLLLSPSHYTVPFSFVPRVCSIMDLGYLKFSGQFKKIVYWQLKYWSAISILVSKKILAISEATSRDIVRHYPFASKKVVVTELGFDSSKFTSKVPHKDVRRIKERYNIVDDYILYLGTLKPNKNVEGLIEAFFNISSDFPRVMLVIAGKKGWMFENIFKKVKELGIEDRIIFTDFFPEEDKAPLMAGAKVFATPSLWEGFGLIALEAMACGTPVVVSNSASFPEIVGSAGVLVDPKNPKSIADGITKVLNMSRKQYNSLREKGLERAKMYSWEKTARKTLNVIDSLVYEKHI